MVDAGKEMQAPGRQFSSMSLVAPGRIVASPAVGDGGDDDCC